VLGYVGNTGNTRGTPSHLHYGIYRQGISENPYPRLVALLRSTARPELVERARPVSDPAAN